MAVEGTVGKIVATGESVGAICGADVTIGDCVGRMVVAIALGVDFVGAGCDDAWVLTAAMACGNPAPQSMMSCGRLLSSVVAPSRLV